MKMNYDGNRRAIEIEGRPQVSPFSGLPRNVCGKRNQEFCREIRMPSQDEGKSVQRIKGWRMKTDDNLSLGRPEPQ
jgi:hypothetical protein